ncbi:thioredoxin family protein [Patescibacteria group bacterium AH-259-L05]|nr:thioredoxin family protein [Patescibacteria group bacterium AH-259-L05]
MTIQSQKSISVVFTITIIAVVFVIAGTSYYTLRSTDQKAQEQQAETFIEKEIIEKEMVEKKDDTTIEKVVEKDEPVPIEKSKPQPADSNLNEDKAEEMRYSGTILAGSLSPFFDFTKTDYDTALKSNKLIVLYFYADWCPICKEELPHLYSAFNELTSDTVIGFRVNYKDRETDADEKNLAKEFGVPYQHTKVFIKNGKKILKSPEVWDKGRYLTEINKAL